MWLFMNDAYLSVVANRHNRDELLVRARRQGDIEATFPGYLAETTPLADYRYRAMIPRPVVATAITMRVLGLDYDNFKNSVPDNPRHDAYLTVWHVMNRYQSEMADLDLPPIEDLFVDHIDELSGQEDESAFGYNLYDGTKGL